MTFNELCDLERCLALHSLHTNREAYSRPYGAVSPDNTVAVGMNGYHYILEGSNQWERQYLGELFLTPVGLQMWLDCIQKRNRIAAELGVNIMHCCAPDKQAVLPQFRWIEPVPARVRLRPVYQIISHLSQHGLSFDYFGDTLLKYGATSELFYRGDSHWCTSSVLVCASIIAQRLIGVRIEAPFVVFRRFPLEPDLVKHFSATPIFEEVAAVAPHGEFDEVELWKKQGGRHTGSRRTIRNDHSKTDRILVIYGDSFSFLSGLDFILARLFREVHIFWRKDVDWDYIQNVGAKYVLWQTAERFVSVVPNL